MARARTKARRARRPRPVIRTGRRRARTAVPATSGVTPAKQLDAFIAKYSREIARVARGALTRMRKRFPGTRELVYDNYNALAIGWSPTGRTSDVICSIALYPRWVSLFFFRGAQLMDPDNRLRGSGKVIRHIVLHSARTLDEPGVRALIKTAIKMSPVGPSGRSRPKTIVMSISAKQRPRRGTFST
jgi:hypothetical protein